MKKTALILALILFLQSCGTTTVITSNVAESDVYIGGKLKGTTPYYHKDKLPLGFVRKVELKKEGYKTYKGRIKKIDRINGMAVFGALMLSPLILWAGTYKHCYQFEMLPNGKTSPVQSDFMNIGEAFNSKKGYHSIYLGLENGKHVLFNQDRLHYLDGTMNMVSTVETKGEIKGEPIDGYISNGKKQLVIFHYDSKKLSFVTIDAKNKSVIKSLQKIRYAGEIIEEDYSYGYMRNKQTNKFVCYSNKSLTLYDENGSSQETYDSEHDFIVESELLSDGRVILLEGNKEGDFYIVEYANGEANSYAVGNKRNRSIPRLSVNEVDGKIFVSTVVFEKDESNAKAFLYSAKLSDLSNFSAKDLELKSIKSNKYLINRGVISDADNDVLCFEEQWKSTTTTSSSTSVKTITGNIQLVNLSKEAPKQKTIYKMVSTSMHLPKLSSQFFMKDGKIYCVYNSQINGRTFLTQSVLDSELNYKTANFRDCYKEDKVIFHPYRAYETDAGELIFLLQYKTKIGMAKSTF